MFCGAPVGGGEGVVWCAGRMWGGTPVGFVVFWHRVVGPCVVACGVNEGAIEGLQRLWCVCVCVCVWNVRKGGAGASVCVCVCRVSACGLGWGGRDR